VSACSKLMCSSLRVLAGRNTALFFFTSLNGSYWFFCSLKRKSCPSACVNSLILRMCCLGLISFLKAFPIWNTPKGSLSLKNERYRMNGKYVVVAVSGLLYASVSMPMVVLIMRLCLVIVCLNRPFLQLGQVMLCLLNASMSCSSV